MHVNEMKMQKTLEEKGKKFQEIKKTFKILRPKNKQFR